MQITRIQKVGGPLTKLIKLGADGKLISDGSACVMRKGRAMRVSLRGVAELGNLIGHLGSSEAITLGALVPGLPDEVEVTTKSGLSKLNGSAPPGVIARTGDYIAYARGQPAPCLFDFDTKAMPDDVKLRLKEAGGFWQALVSVVPELASVARILRPSTSAGISRVDTGEKLPGSNGRHLYVVVGDGTDIERFLPTLHARCFLAGFGWLMVGAGGQMLERSIIDRTVLAPERLVFEGAAILGPGLVQDNASRRPVVKDGGVLDTVSACPALSLVELASLKEMRCVETHRLAPDSAKAKAEFIKIHARKLAERGLSAIQAAKVIDRQTKGILLPALPLSFDDPDMAGATVGDIIADPERFLGATLADPLEGPQYGQCKAKVMQRPDGTLWVHSFAHGRTAYDIKLDLAAVETVVNSTAPNDTAALFVQLVLVADLDIGEIERLRDLTAARAGVTKRAIEQKLKSGIAERDKQRANEERNRRIAERRDPRPQLEAPAADAPWLPQIQALNDVLKASKDLEPPMRDVDGYLVAIRERRIPNSHLLTSAGSNDEETEETRLPAPAQPLLTRLDEPQNAELIERHIDYVSLDGRSVHLATAFVKHYQIRIDNVLPIVAAVSTLPIVRLDGSLLARPGLNRDLGIVFRIAPELLFVLPKREDCTPWAVGEAMRFLCDDWLCDVETDYSGKAVIVSAGLSLIERNLLANRPAFLLTAPRRGGGKTTLLMMLLMAVTGVSPSAAAWSTNEEERRKSLLAYLLEGSVCIIWDNLARGMQISCPHIERACTTETYTDRRLGVTENIATSASTIQFFTGNNIAARGELSSRTLQVSLKVDRADPENRVFKHTDPIGWTEAHRGKILAAFFTILMGNPNVRPGANTQNETRFHTWWRLIGSAVENAALQHGEAVEALTTDAIPTCQPQPVSFKNLFLAQEDEDEESASLGDVLAAMQEQWKEAAKNRKAGQFAASDIANLINDQSEYVLEDVKIRRETMRQYLFPNAQSQFTATAKGVGKRLKARLNEPVRHGEETLILRSYVDEHANAHVYFVKAVATA